MNNELYHYGVPGMRWGKRKKQLKQEYESRMKKANEKWQKEYGSLEDQYTYGKKTNAKKNAILDKQMDRVDKTYKNEMSKAKSDYKQGKANLKAEKKEFKSYMKKMNKYGRPGSLADESSGGQSTKLYNEIKVKKGKTYADSVSRSLGKKYVRQLTATTIATGAAFAATLIPHIRATIQDNKITNPNNFRLYKVS